MPALRLTRHWSSDNSGILTLKTHMRSLDHHFLILVASPSLREEFGITGF